MTLISCLFSGRTVIRFPLFWSHNYGPRLCVHNSLEKIRNYFSEYAETNKKKLNENLFVSDLSNYLRSCQ